MLVQPYERPASDAMLSQMVDSGDGLFSPGFSQAPELNGRPLDDSIRRLMPPSLNSASGMFGTTGSASFLNGLFSQLGSLLQQLGGLLQFSIPGGNLLGGLFGANQQYFQSANGGSVGDPHLSFNGNHWDNMASQPDLLESDSFNGGYRVSTQVTPPNANGVTYNQSASVTSNYGQTNVTLDKSGNAAIVQDGIQVPIALGQTIDIGNGQTVTRTQNGLQVTANNGMGGQITTIMTANGQGVDVQNTANNVDLGGSLVTSQAQPGQIHLPRPIMRPYDLNIYRKPLPLE